MDGDGMQVKEFWSGFGICLERGCFVDAIYPEDDRAVMSSTCRGCGCCEDVCPNHATELIIEDS
jgi:MinD superfamily P-loop ATPase